MSKVGKKSWLIWIPGFIRKDFFRKLIALFFALLVWWKVSSVTGIKETIRSVPVEIRTAGNVTVLGPTNKVNIIVRGSQKKISNLSPTDIKVELSVMGVEFTSRQQLKLKINKSHVKTPVSLHVVNIEPDLVRVMVDRLVMREIPLKARFTGTLHEDYACGEVKLSKDKVVVSGPKSEVEGIVSLHTEPIRLDEKIKENFDLVVDVSTDMYEDIEVSPSKLTASVEIYRKYLSRTFHNVPVHLMHGNFKAGNYRIDLAEPSVDVTIQGVRSVIELMDGSEIKPFVDITDLKNVDGEKEITREVRCFQTIPDMQIHQITPSEIKLKVAPAD